VLQSKLFAKTKKETPKEAQTISHKLLLRGDFIEALSSGVYSFLPLGWKVHKKIETIIRQELDKIGAQEIHLPVLQPKSLWEKTNRWETFEPPLFKIEDRHKRQFTLGPTHEEVISDLASRHIYSYKDLPLALYQIQTKFRNEARPTGGLLRTVEFYMKDLYSFHTDEDDLKNYYEQVKKAYFNIFERCKLQAKLVEASVGSIGGTMSHEFMILAESGEDKIALCQKCSFAANLEIMNQVNTCPNCKSSLSIKNAIEQGHIFNLGKKYSSVFNIKFLDKNGKTQTAVMGCYGIGIGRLMATIVEVHHDKNGIIWPPAVSPFAAHLITLNQEQSKVYAKAQEIYNLLKQNNVDVLFDDRLDLSAGQKFADADLIGIPIRIVISTKTLSQNAVEVKRRNENEGKLISIKNLLKFLT
jgi:prolyl-tRNA synthetase